MKGYKNIIECPICKCSFDCSGVVDPIRDRFFIDVDKIINKLKEGNYEGIKD